MKKDWKLETLHPSEIPLHAARPVAVASCITVPVPESYIPSEASPDSYLAQMAWAIAELMAVVLVTIFQGWVATIFN